MVSKSSATNSLMRLTSSCNPSPVFTEIKTASGNFERISRSTDSSETLSILLKTISVRLESAPSSCRTLRVVS